MTYKRKEVIGDCTLYLGDCMDILPHLEKADACLTDPPYGYTDFNITRTGGPWSKKYQRDNSINEWDFKPSKECFDMILSCSEDQIIWGGNYFTENLKNNRGFLIWHKKTISESFSMAMAEYAWISMNINAKVFHFAPQDPERAHPTQKPVALMKWCLGFLPDSETILDPFTGSGTTGVACVKLGRKFIGIELDEKYFDIACKRIEEAYLQPDMFIEAPPKPIQDKLI
jgi:DNA modification methylase